MRKNTSPIFDKIQTYCTALEKEFALIPNERQSTLLTLAEYLSHKFQRKEIPKIIVICTHNSRRSHLGQIWLAVAADYYGFPEVQTFSGGTEATAFNPRAVQALKRVGFSIQQEEFISPTNPIYQISWKKEQIPYLAFSKKYEDAPNPTEAFAAIMVCTDADEGCPVIPKVEFRLSLPYDDPKAFDDTGLEATKYGERCRQIGREILFCFHQILISR